LKDVLVTGGNAYAQCTVVKVISIWLQSSDQPNSIYCRSAPWLQSFAVVLDVVTSVTLYARGTDKNNQRNEPMFNY